MATLRLIPVISTSHLVKKRKAQSEEPRSVELLQTPLREVTVSPLDLKAVLALQIRVSPRQ